MRWKHSVSVVLAIVITIGCSRRTETDEAKKLAQQVEQLKKQNEQLSQSLREQRNTPPEPVPAHQPPRASPTAQISIADQHDPPSSANTQYNLAREAFRKRDYAKARAGFNTLLKQAADDEADTDAVLIEFHVYMTLLLGGKEAQAEKMITKFESAGDTPALSFAHAAWEFKHDNKNKAAEWLRSAHKIYPASANVIFAESFYDLGWMGRPIRTTEINQQAAFAEWAMKSREQAMLKVEPQAFVPTSSRPATRRYAWKINIATTVFWIGETIGKNRAAQRKKSAWDPHWMSNYGGLDDPDPSVRQLYIPISFIPRQNPFYCALPYNDCAHSYFKEEAPLIIPWFKQAYTGPGQSVCKSRWLAIRKGNRTCYAQWEDCGPFRSDDVKYVFGNERPKADAGMSVSPAVRDYLELKAIDSTDWQFVDVRDVPPGPWRSYGENNNFVIAKRQLEMRVIQQSANEKKPTQEKTPNN